MTLRPRDPADRGTRGHRRIGRRILHRGEPTMTLDASSGSHHSKADYTDFEHVGPGTLAGRYLRRFWQPLYRAEDLAPGWAKPVRLMNEDFTLYRGEGGTPHVVAFR